MAKVVTLTPNPALDIATHVEQLIPEHKMRCGPVRRDPGGGGVNVARVVHRLGGKSIAVYSCGGGTGDELRALLQAEGLEEHAVPVAGHTRESFNVTEYQTHRQFRFVLPGDPLSEAEWRNSLDVTLSMLEEGDYLVVSGSLPPGVPVDFYARALRAAKIKRVATVVDTHGPSLKAVLNEGVDILKASAREFAELLEISPPVDFVGWSEAGRTFVKSGKVGTVAITLGERGAVLITPLAAFHVSVPNVPSLTTVGAGDSFLGGFLVKLVDGKPFQINRWQVVLPLIIRHAQNLFEKMALGDMRTILSLTPVRPYGPRRGRALGFRTTHAGWP